MKKYIKQMAVVAIASVMAVGFTMDNTVVVEAGKTLSQLKNERNDLSKKTKEAKAQLEAIKNKKASVEEELEAISNMLKSIQDEINKSEEELADVQNRLELSNEELKKAEEAKDRQMKILGKRIKFFYEQGDIGYLDVIFEAENFSDMLTRAQYVHDIMEYDNNILENLKENQKIIEEKTAQIEEEKKTVEELMEVQEQKRSEVLVAMEENKAIINSYKDDQKKYEQLIAAHEKSSQEVERLIAQATGGSDSGSTYVYTGGKLNWPVPSRAASSSSISSGFVNRMSPVGRGWEKHTGYDIPSGYGTAIVAAEAGTVIHSGWMNGYGYTVMINHGGGLVTLYGHNSSLVVKKGQSVSRGQQIAKCGSTGYSTGNHCHFEVRENGKAVSPEPYLGVPNVNY